MAMHLGHRHGLSPYHQGVQLITCLPAIGSMSRWIPGIVERERPRQLVVRRGADGEIPQEAETLNPDI